MEVDSPDVNGCSTPGTKENGLHLYPVSANDAGEGLPYAPVDWPNPGDNWSWKVGRRITTSGYFLDRYLCPPSHFPIKERIRKRFSGLKDRVRRKRFSSKRDVEKYIRAAFPSVDLDAFFASFSWKIPSKQLAEKIGDKWVFLPSAETTEQSGNETQVGKVTCEAGNESCASLAGEENSLPEWMTCNICCAERGFCRYCCCILCSRPASSAYGGYSYIRCEARVNEGYVCGHVAHIDCGLRAYMAGTVGGSIGLDAEYYCRRCDSRTDLISHVSKLVQTCETIDSRVVIEKILDVGSCLLRGSEKASAQTLLHQIQLALAKLKKGTNLEDVWQKEEPPITGGVSDNGGPALNSTTQPNIDSRDESPRPLCSKFDQRVETLRLEDEIDQVLQALKTSQDCEYKLAKERLLAQKNHIQNLYEQLNKERRDLSMLDPSTADTSLLDAVLKRVEQVKQEVIKFKDMEKVAKGFGKTSKNILKEHFGLETEE